VKERRFKVRVKVKDTRKSTIQQKSITHAYDSPLARAVRNKKRNKLADYRPPTHGKRKK